MIERTGGLRLAQQARACVLVVRDGRREELESDFAVQAFVFRQVDDSHGAGADRSDDPVVRDSRTNHLVSVVPGAGKRQESRQ
jgi:hypothetical protein